MQTVKGSFEVEMHAEPPYDERDGLVMGRARFEKRFSGALDATSTVQMLSVRNLSAGVGTYVALERIEGTLDGRAGSFVVHHVGIQRSDGRSLTIAIVPDTGAGALRGITGHMDIEITEGKHFYSLSYEIPD